MNFAKFLRTPFLQNPSGRLLLHTDCKASISVHCDPRRLSDVLQYTFSRKKIRKRNQKYYFMSMYYVYRKNKTVFSLSGLFERYFSHLLLIGTIIYIKSEKCIKNCLRYEKYSQKVLR